MTEQNKDNGNGKINPEQNKPQPEPKDLILTIAFKTDGSLQVNGPGNGQLYDEPMCDYMLKKAGRFIENHNARATASQIIPAKGGIMNFARNRFRR